MTPLIDIRRRHALDADQARTVIGHLAGSLEEKFGVTPTWKGNVLHFARQGVDGFIAVSGDEVHVSARLGMLLAPLKPAVESEIRRKLDKYFPSVS